MRTQTNQKAQMNAQSTDLG